MTDRDPSAVRAHLAMLTERIDELNTEADECRAWLGERLGEGTHVLASGRLSVHRSRRFDPRRAETVLPPTLVERCSRPVVQRDLVARHASATLYQACQIEGRLTVRLT